ncbi:MAG: alkaline phosphatase D family protein [Bryobacteraceae bacterium]
MRPRASISRREVLGGLAGVRLFGQAPGIVRSDRPLAAEGAMAGDADMHRATIWSRCDRPARMLVSWSTSERGETRLVRGPVCGPGSDYTGRVELEGLPGGETILYQVRFEDAANSKAVSEPVTGKLRTASERGIRFLWSGDTCGQGWGINREWGGMRMYETMRRREPDFFIHSGDTIYADGPIPAEQKLPDGTLWRNVVTEAKSKVAETLDEFRGNYRYNLLDENLRRFHAETPQIWQWDDHELMNNWSPSKDLRDDNRYREKRLPILVERARRAFREYSPIRSGAPIHRRIEYGPLLDVFVIDLRSFRGPNTYNRQPVEGPETAYLGKTQLAWLVTELRRSRATWRVIASDMPLGLIVGDGKDAQGRERFEASANGHGPALGRELEIASLLSALKKSAVRNTVWLTADVHYTAAHYYEPAKARFTDFLPFWEFVSGPLNAGTFGPGKTDDTFGLEVKYQKHPPAGQANLSPAAGMQFFGEVEVQAEEMTVTLRDLAGNGLYRQRIQAGI